MGGEQGHYVLSFTKPVLITPFQAQLIPVLSLEVKTNK